MEEKKLIKRKEKALCDGNREQLAICCNYLGDFYNQQGRYNDAVEEYQQEVELFAKLKKTLEMAKALRMVGEMFMMLGAFEDAKENIDKYLKTVKQLQNKVEEQRAYATLGRVHLLEGQSLSETSASEAMTQLKQAEKAFLKSLLLTKELTGHISKLEQLDMQARCYLNIGVVKEHMEEFEESIAYMEKAIKISKSHDIFELTHMCYISMSLLYHYKKNDATLALRYCNLALEVAKRLPQKVKKICETLMTKSEILIKVGDFASAKQILTKAYKKNSPDENDRTAIEKSLRIVVKICQILDELVTTSSLDYGKQKSLYEKLGDGCCHLTNYAKAIEYYEKMLECAQHNNESGKNLIPIYVSLYQTYKDNRQYDKALEYLWKEFDINKDTPAEAFSTLCVIAEICELQMQPFWTIYDVYQKAKEQANRAGDVKSKLEKIIYTRLKKLLSKHNMNILQEELIIEAECKGIALRRLDDDVVSETDSDLATNENNTPELGEDVCLDDLTDTDASDLDETEKPRPHRVTRGTRYLTIKRNNKGETQLHQACIAGNIELVRRLLDQGHVVNIRDHAGWTPLHEACNHGFRDIVELLLDRGGIVAINDKGGTSCDGITPLYDACSNGYLDVVELLLERGADVTLKTDFGETCENGLDKWRRSVTLTEGEQAQYAEIKERLRKQLSKINIFQSASENVLSKKTIETKSHCNTALLSEDESNSENETEIEPSTSHWHGNERHIRSDPLSQKTTASDEYRNVMENVKHPNHFPKAFNNSLNFVGKQKRPAYTDTNEVDEKSWLIDDVGQMKKKRRRCTTPTKNSHFNSYISHKLPKKEIMYDSNTNSARFRETETSNSNSQQLQRETGDFHLSSHSTINNNSNVISSYTQQRNKAKHQTSLLDSGFYRFRNKSSISSDDSVDSITSATMEMRATEPDSTTTSVQLVVSPIKTSPVELRTAPVISSSVSFKIKVENELLLIPVERRKLNDINIRWLADEASRRYYNLVGLKPVLRLKTADGFAYEESDAVVAALEQNMILATVLEWGKPPLALRYGEMCHKLHREENIDVKLRLERAQISNIVQLEDLWLTPVQMEPISKAIFHHTNLRVLDLSNNFIQNDGCRQLSKSLPTLQHLRTLNLKGNFITCDGLEALLTASGIEKLEYLEELILSYNPLGDNCIYIIEKFCKAMAPKSLQKLHFSNCCITELYDCDLHYNDLSDLDISFNKLNVKSLRHLLSKLNSCRLQNLNLSYSRKLKWNERNDNDISECITNFFESGTCEKFKRIQLGGLKLNDSDVYRMVQCLTKTNDLELLDISGNMQLTSSSLYVILEKLPQLRKLIAINCSRILDTNSLQRFTQFKQIPNFISLTLAQDEPELASKHEQLLRMSWLSHWGDKAKFRSYNSNVLLFINENDLCDI